MLLCVLQVYLQLLPLSLMFIVTASVIHGQHLKSKCLFHANLRCPRVYNNMHAQTFVRSCKDDSWNIQSDTNSKDSSINMKPNLEMVLFQISWQLHEVNILLWWLQAASHSNLSLSIRPITDVWVELVLPTMILLAHG